MPDQATRMREIAQHYRQAALATKPYMLTITSGKGGVGKSTIALNLAIKLCDTGKRVLLFDADANLAGLNVMLGISPRYRLSHVLRGERDIEDVLFSPYSRLKILAGSSGEVDYPVMTGPLQAQLLDDLLMLEERFDVLLVDTGAGLNPEIIGYTEHADETLVVTGVEPTAVMDAYAMIKVIVASKNDAQISLVLNNARLPREAEEAAAKLQLAVTNFLKRDIRYLGSVPYDANVAKAVVGQQPVVRAFPLSAASLSIQSIAQMIVHRSLHSSVRRVAAS